jgi:uncharacterized OB-fold protein
VRFDLPAPDDETVPFWDAARTGTFLIKRCADCGAAHFYPRPFCPRCWSTAVTWEAASGRAALYTWSVVHHNDLPPFSERLPYVAAAVDLAEGPRMMTTVVDCDAERLRVGLPLQVAYREIAEHVTIPVFAPV